MTKQTEALKMAIDCLEYHYKHGAWGMDIEGVIVYCKEALAQPAQEPVISNEQYLDLLYEYCKLKAVNERLREALERLAKLGNEPNYGNSIGNDIAKEALSATPAQSLIEHDNEVIERCAVAMERKRNE